MMHKIKMIGFDLDGTLLTTDKRLTEYTENVLKQAIDKGIIVLPATGRPLTGIPEEILHFPGVKYAVTANGGRIVETEKKKIVYEKLLPVEKARKILDIFEEYDTLREVYFDGRGYIDEEKLSCIDRYLETPSMAQYIRTTRVPVPDVRRKFEQENRGMDKIQALFASQEEKIEAWKRIEDLGGVEVTGALSCNIEVNAGGINKGMALCLLGEKLGIKREEIMAFGDGANDIKMIKEVGVGVAMSNGIPKIIEASDIVAESNDKDGVAKIIEQYVLNI